MILQRVLHQIELAPLSLSLSHTHTHAHTHKTTNPEVSFFNPPLDKLKKTKTHLRADVGHTCMYSF
jgi:hypothetical protein